jgi:hypothetical protein
VSAPPSSSGFTTTVGILQPGYLFSPEEEVTADKINSIVLNMRANFALLYEAIINAGGAGAPAYVRFANGAIQVLNTDTGNWHPVWIVGAQPKTETWEIGEGISPDPD